MLIITEFDKDKFEVSVLDTDDEVTESVQVIQLIDLVERGIVSCTGFTITGKISSSILCCVEVGTEQYNLMYNKRSGGIKVSCSSERQSTEDENKDEDKDEDTDVATNTPVKVNDNDNIEKIGGITRVKKSQNKVKVKKEKKKEVTVEDSIPDLSSLISSINKKLQSEFEGRLRVTFTGDMHSKWVLCAANNEFTYFVGKEVIITLDSKLSSDFETKNRVLEVLSEIPFVNVSGESVNLLDVCCGTCRNIDVYAAFSPELTSPDGASKIEVVSSM